MGSMVDIVILAVIAALIIARLRSVLGRRTGDEQPPRPPFSRRDAQEQSRATDRDGKVVQLPGTAQAQDRDDALQTPSPIPSDGSPLASSLTDLQLADRSFTPDSFLEGARSAYELIVTSFAAGDRDALQPLLADEVYRSFDSVIASRERNGQTVESRFIGIENAEIVAASFKDRIAEVTVKFISEMISATKDSQGAVIEGDPKAIRRITDVWTFARDIASRNPNWKLVGTAAGG